MPDTQLEPQTADAQPLSTATVRPIGTLENGVTTKLGVRGMLGLAAWFGLAAGLLEILAQVVCTAFGLHGRLYQMSRHFVWLIPVVNLFIFLFLGFFLAALALVWPRFGRWLGVRVLATLAMVPPLLVAGPEIYALAWFVLAWGVSLRLASLLERRAASFRRFVVYSFPLFVGSVVILAGSVFGSDWWKQTRESGRPLPPAGSPNVLLIVLDTVRADHMSAYGYARPTTPTLERLAARGVRFDNARTTAPWTLPAHASLFTGKLPHELGVRFVSPVNMRFPTLAGYLGSRGYATAGFVGNVLYCSHETGLAQGFTHYEDYRLEKLDGVFLSKLADRALVGFFVLSYFVRAQFKSEFLAPAEKFVRNYIVQPDSAIPRRRKDAGMVNREFLSWLSDRREPDRPFFAFLNYFDAHTPYFPPPPRDQHFGLYPMFPGDDDVLLGWEEIDKLALPPRLRMLARDSYDDCIRSMDEQIQVLISGLAQRRLLDKTIVIVTSDHGEAFGEHDLFLHAGSLFLPEVHVPLIVMTPQSKPAQSVVKEAVSLVDVPATIVDLVGLSRGSPISGTSLADALTGTPPTSPVVSELAENHSKDPNQGRTPATLGPLASLERGRYRYIHRSIHEKEELYDITADPGELRDLAGEPAMKPVLERLRSELRSLAPY